MIDYFEQLMQEEQEAVTEVIQLLYRQTFLLERKFDKRSGRLAYVKEYRTCSKHFEFLKEYFAIGGISLRENAHMGLIYIQGETLWGEKLPRLATVYTLILKLIYDEQMALASTSIQVYTSLGEMNARAGEFGLLRGTPSPTEIRRAITLLKRYQILEPLDLLDALDGDSRMIIYPSVNAVLLGDDVRELLRTFSDEEEDERIE